MKPTVYITRKLPENAIQPLLDHFEVRMWESEAVTCPNDVLAAEIKHADALLSVITDDLNESILEQAENLKIIANMAVGFDNIDVAAATRLEIAVTNTPDVLSDTTADLAFGLLMATARRMMEAETFIKADQWKSWSPFLLAGHDIHHKTIGIVGMGQIGEKVAKRATGFDMNILYYNRTRKHEAETALGATYCTFDELLSKADFVVCMAPLTNETRGMFSEESFKKMKNSAIFINASRGAVVDESALYNALKNGDIAAAGLDVFDVEPIRADHPLLQLPNVVALPHIGSASLETRLAMIHLCVENIIAVLSNQSALTLVNKELQGN